MLKTGTIMLDGEEVEPHILRDFRGVAILEIVNGQYRIENLERDEDVQEQGDK